MSPRIKAFLIHLGLSSAIVIIALGLVLYVWYPAPLAKASGATRLFSMLLVINIIIGPMLTLLVYKKGKKTLKFDLSIIILLQLCAFIYGFYHIAQGRPAWLVFNINKFELVRANDILEGSAFNASKEFQQPSWLGPEYVALPSIYSQQANTNVFKKSVDGLSSAQYPDRYTSLKQANLTMKSNSQDLESLEDFNKKIYLDKVLQKYPEANAWVPLKANAVDMVVLMNKDKGEVIKIVDLRPWN